MYYYRVRIRVNCAPPFARQVRQDGQPVIVQFAYDAKMGECLLYIYTNSSSSSNSSNSNSNSTCAATIRIAVLLVFSLSR